MVLNFKVLYTLQFITQLNNLNTKQIICQHYMLLKFANKRFEILVNFRRYIIEKKSRNIVNKKAAVWIKN